MEIAMTRGGWIDYFDAALGSNHGGSFYGPMGVVTG